MKIIIWFLVLYPMTMSLFWMIGSIFYKFTKKNNSSSELVLSNITIFIPCYNEEETINKVMQEILKHGQLLQEIILIDNGSTDNTWNELIALSKLDRRIQLLKTDGNTGKANALNTALNYTSADFIVCIDADALIEKNTIEFLVDPFRYSKKLGAVTGNPRVKNTHNLLAKLQLIGQNTVVSNNYL